MKVRRRDELGRFLPAKQVKKRKRDAVGRSSPDKKRSLKVAAKSPKKTAKKIAPSSPKKFAEKIAARPLKKPARKVAASLPKKPARKIAARSPKKPARKIAARPPKKPARKIVARPPKKPARKIAARPSKKPARKIAARPPKKPARKILKKGLRPKVPKRLAKKILPKPRKKPPKRRKPRLPRIDERSRDAERAIQERLISLSEAVNVLQPGLDMGVQSMVNIDKTVDGELRVGILPAEWREPGGLRDLIATFSNAIASFRVFPRYPPMGGSFWFSVAVRFGPQNEMEMQELAKLYKKNKGLFQIGTYPVRADHPAPLQICLTDDRQGLRSMIGNLEEKRGLPPTNILIRLIWGPDWHPDVSGKRPGHYKGEK